MPTTKGDTQARAARPINQRFAGELKNLGGSSPTLYERRPKYPKQMVGYERLHQIPLPYVCTGLIKRLDIEQWQK
jgi:hypothetical protein